MVLWNRRIVAKGFTGTTGTAHNNFTGDGLLAKQPYQPAGRTSVFPGHFGGNPDQAGECSVPDPLAHPAGASPNVEDLPGKDGAEYRPPPSTVTPCKTGSLQLNRLPTGQTVGDWAPLSGRRLPRGSAEGRASPMPSSAFSLCPIIPPAMDVAAGAAPVSRAVTGFVQFKTDGKTEES